MSVILKKIKHFYILEILLCIFLSFIFFRGRIGADDLEVFNLVYDFFQSNMELSSYLKNLSSESLNKNLYDANTSHSYLTYYHRFIWVFQTYLIFNLVDFFSFFGNKNNFFSQYFSGYILTLYVFLSFFLCSNLFKKKKLNNYESYFLASCIFFGTGIITFVTGSYIESLIIFLLLLRLHSTNLYSKFINDFLIILIKPYYLIIVVSLQLTENKFLISSKNTKKKIYKRAFTEIFLYIFFIVFLFLLFRYFAFDNTALKKYTSAFFPDIAFGNLLLKRLLEIFFSYGSGLIFAIPFFILMIFFGYLGYNSAIKIFFTLILVIFLCIAGEQHHGAASGNRYLIPLIFLYLDEISKGFKYLKSYKFFLFFLFFFTLFHFSVLEFRNFNIAQYSNNSAFTGKVKDFELFSKPLPKWPLWNINFNHIVFANKIVFYKLNKKKTFNLSNFNVDISNVYPMTGLKRLIFISENNISIYDNDFIIKLKSHLIFLKILYYLSISTLFLAYILIFRKVLQLKN